MWPTELDVELQPERDIEPELVPEPVQQHIPTPVAAFAPVVAAEPELVATQDPVPDMSVAVAEPDATEVGETARVDEVTRSTDVDLSRPYVLGAYQEFSGELPPISAGRSAITDGLRDIVAIEGPILGTRLQGVYVRCSGGQRVGREIARALNSAMTAAVREGVLVEEDPLGQPGIKPKTYRLPGQPRVRPRELGPRLLEAVPPVEIATIMAHAANELGWSDEQQLFKATLDVLGLQRLTKNVQAHLLPLLRLARQEYERLDH